MGGVNQRTLPVDFFFSTFLLGGGHGGHGGHGPTIERILPKLVGASALTRLGLPHTVCVRVSTLLRAAVGAEASTYSRDGCGLHTALAVRVNERRVAPAPFGAPSGCPRTGAGPPAARPPGRGLDAWRRACPRPLCQKSGVHSVIIFTMSYAHWKRSSALETRIAKPADLRAPRLPLFALSSYTHCRAEGMATQRGCAGGPWRRRGRCHSTRCAVLGRWWTC